LVKAHVSITIDRDLLKKVDDLVKVRFLGVTSRSAVIEYYLKKGLEVERADISVVPK
jgi:metal-responsive CopG/Arc/MetJ family transcriptional regulator